MHVIFLAPHFPANQIAFVRGLKRVGARVTGIIDTPLSHVASQVKELLDDVEVVDNVTSVAQVTDAVRRIQRRGQLLVGGAERVVVRPDHEPAGQQLAGAEPVVGG